MNSYLKNMLVVGLTLTFSNALAQDANAPVWGVYASGVGEPLKAGMDPCQITYTVAFMSDPNIVENLSYGTMGAVGTSLTWNEASALRRTYGRYFDDGPDGVFKLTPCEIELPNINGTWNSAGRGKYSISQSGNTFSGSAMAVNAGDHWGKGHREGGSIRGEIEPDGTIVIRTQWGDGTYTEEYMRLSADETTLSGTWNWFSDSSKAVKKGSGSYSLFR